MNDIRLSPYGGLLRGIKLEVNGVEMQEVFDINLHCPVDAVPVLTVEQFAVNGLEVTLNGIVKPTLIVNEIGAEVIVDHPTPGTTRYRVTVRKDA